MTSPSPVRRPGASATASSAPVLRRALVTGASGGIGQAIAERLGRNGAHVIAHANSNVAGAEAVVARIVGAGGSAEAIAFDVTDVDSARAACERLLEGGAIQIVVNNAGVHDDAVFPGMRAEQWRRVIDVSVNGFFNVTQPLVMAMMRTRWGRIVNVSSIASLTGNRGQVNYSAAKGALNSATKALALELASRGITVNAVAPGIIDAGMAEAVFDRADGREARADEARRHGERGRRAGRLPRLRRRRLHQRPGRLDQWRDDLTGSAASASFGAVTTAAEAMATGVPNGGRPASFRAASIGKRTAKPSSRRRCIQLRSALSRP
jgi:3-oxoacyl-[acyl-carrier protein] reductase